MKTTGNLGLKKPDGTDIVDITDLNGNMDILDTAVKTAQDHAADAVKHITAAERTAWNAKASTSVATTTAAGLMAGADKSKLDSVAQGANNYVHPSTHSPSVIVQDSSNRFVTDAEKMAWNGKANLSTTPQQTTADITYYVRTDGNDGNTGLGNTAGGAFRTIQKAINSIPYHADHLVTVSVQPGTYPEDVKVFDFNGSTEIYINGGGSLAAASSYIVNSFYVYGCTNQIVIQGFTVTTATSRAFAFVNSNFCQLWNSRAVASNTTRQNGVEASNGSTVRVSNCEISNKASAIQATQGANVLSVNNTGSSNSFGIESAEGGFIRKNGTQPGANVQEYAQNGGIIHSGVLNPWGDNTHASRPMVWAGTAADHPLSANAWTMIKYAGVSTNQMGGYSGTTGVFTSPQTGWYKVRASGLVANVQATVQCQLRVLQAGVSAYTIDVKNAGSVSMHLLLAGEILLYLPLGDYFIIQGWSSNSATITGGNDISRLEIVRVA